VQQLDLADFTAIGGGSSWTAPLNFIPLDQGDVIFGQVTTAGVSCTNFSPFTVALTSMPAAGICYATPSACVGVTGFTTGANGLATANYSISFALNQIGFIGGPAPAGSGNATGLCEQLGAHAGDICYFNGTNWVILNGNESSEEFLTETSGVPSWQAGIGGTIYAENLEPIYSSPCTLAGGTPCSDFAPTALPTDQSYVLRGPFPSSVAASNVIQDVSCGLSSVGPVSCTISTPLPGSFIVVSISTVEGIDTPDTFTITDTNSDTYTTLDVYCGGSSRQSGRHSGSGLNTSPAPQPEDMPRQRPASTVESAGRQVRRNLGIFSGRWQPFPSGASLHERRAASPVPCGCADGAAAMPKLNADSSEFCRHPTTTKPSISAHN